MIQIQELEENLIIRESSEQKGGLFKQKKVEITVITRKKYLIHYSNKNYKVPNKRPNKKFVRTPWRKL